MSDNTPEKPIDAELKRALIEVAQQAAAEQAADPEWQEILFTPENKYGTPYPKGSEMDYKELRQLSLRMPASMLVQ